MRTGKKQIGQFDIKPGMAFTMNDMISMSPNGEWIKANEHPWLIITVNDKSVEIVMCTTLINDHDNKHRSNNLKYDNMMDIPNGCPPLDSPKIRVNAVSMDTIFVLPKKKLFSHKLKLLNQSTKERNFTTEGYGSLCMDEKELQFI